VSVSSRSLFFLTNSTPWLLLQLSSNPLYCSISKIPRLLRLGTHPQFLPAKMVIHRVTMFKVKDTSNIPTILEQYKILNSNAVRNGKPYILAISAGGAGPDSRSQGWNFAVKSQYATKEDMDFYDNDCEAHIELKKVARPLVEGVMTVWWDSEGGVEFSRL